MNTATTDPQLKKAMDNVRPDAEAYLKSVARMFDLA